MPHHCSAAAFHASHRAQPDTDGAGDAIAPEKNVLLVSDVGKNRLPTVHTFDARVSKNITYKRMNVNIDLDMFNLYNTATVLGREYDLASDGFNEVREIVNTAADFAQHDREPDPSELYTDVYR